MRIDFSIGKNDFSFTLFDVGIHDREQEEAKAHSKNQELFEIIAPLATQALPFLISFVQGSKDGMTPPQSGPDVFESDDEDFDPANFVDPHSGYVREVRNMDDLIKVANEFNARLQRIEKHLAEDDGDMSSDA